jgi:hypothetical protein
MLDRRSREEFEGVLALGRLADRMVFTLGRSSAGNRSSPTTRPHSRQHNVYSNA